MKIIIKKFHVILITLLLLPPSAVDCDARRPGRRGRPGHPGRRARGIGGGDGHDSDFNEFMEKMYSILPQRTVMGKAADEIKRGPNLGYDPYWYGPLIPGQVDVNYKPPSLHGLDNTGGALWGKSRPLLGDHAQLGAGPEGDNSGEAGQDKACSYNLGPDCVLGPKVTDLTEAQIAEYQERTTKCDNLCTYEKSKTGLVCTRDKTGTIYQEMDFCVMEKTNCLKGIAVVRSKGREGDWRRVPFVFKNGFGRISIRQALDAHLYFHNEVPGHRGRKYWMVLDGFPADRHSALYVDDRSFASWTRWPSFPYYTRALTWEWREFTVRWDPHTGYFLFSQGRVKYWWETFYLEYWDPWPWHIRYIDVSSRNGHTPQYVLHDLELVNTGDCRWGPTPVVVDTKEVVDESIRVVNQYFNRISGITRPFDYYAPYIEYPTN